MRSTIKEILKETKHRPYTVPKGDWIYYQEWNRALFLHWIVPHELLRECVPTGMNIDTFEGNCYISLVAFTMEKIRPKYLPSISFISDFDEINIRTYIDNNGKQGVYFLNIEAGKSLSTFLSKALSGLPYEKANTYRAENMYHSENVNKGFNLHAEFEVKSDITDKSDLTKWLTERYCLYLDENKKIFRYDIHHVEWPLQEVEINNLTVDYRIGKIVLAEQQQVLSQYSEGVKVVAWQKENILANTTKNITI